MDNQPPTSVSPGSPQPQPPMGTSPVTQATPNKGYEAAGLQKLGAVLKQMGDALPLVGITSEPGKVLVDCIRKLQKFVPDGSVSPASERNQLQSAMQRNTQNNQQMAALKAQMQGQGGAQGGAPGGGPPQMPKAA